jgi:hypothetical protein
VALLNAGFRSGAVFADGKRIVVRVYDLNGNGFGLRLAPDELQGIYMQPHDLVLDRNGMKRHAPRPNASGHFEPMNDARVRQVIQRPLPQHRLEAAEAKSDDGLREQPAEIATRPRGRLARFGNAAARAASRVVRRSRSLDAATRIAQAQFVVIRGMERTAGRLRPINAMEIDGDPVVICSSLGPIDGLDLLPHSRPGEFVYAVPVGRLRVVS